MNNLTEIYIGVDISKDYLDIFIYPTGKSYRIKNADHDIKQFIKKINVYNVKQIACEATGGYEILLKKLLKKSSLNLKVIDPRRIQGFKSASGMKAKTDKIDAKIIAEFIQKNENGYKEIEKSENLEILQSLVNRKNDLTLMLASEKNRLKHPSHERSIKSIETVIEFFETNIKQLTKEIQKLIASDNELNKKAKILESVPGVGPIAACTLLSFLPELGQVNSKQASALLGTAPYDNASGKFKGKSYIKGGRSVPRKVLYMCALTATNCNLILKNFYQKLLSTNKPSKVALVAVMNKLIKILNTMMKNGETWRTNIA